MKQSEFNEKYKDYLSEGHYGLALINPLAIEYLDNKFQEYIKIPDFKYQQIKSKWNSFCFYASGISLEERESVEQKLKEIHNVQAV